MLILTFDAALLRNESHKVLEKTPYPLTSSSHTKTRSDGDFKEQIDEEKEVGSKEQFTRIHIATDKVSDYQVHAIESEHAHPPLMKLQVSPYQMPPILNMTHLLWGTTAGKKNIMKNTSYTITKKKLRHAKKMLRAAFVEYYRGLGLLKTFR